MPTVYASYPVQNDNSPHTAYVTGQIDLAKLLSEHYGKEIRQGQSFKVTGVQAFLKPADNSVSAFVDIGVSAAVQFQYVPAVKHSRAAWNSIFKQWRAQKNLKGAVGSQIRYDDCEFAWSAATTNTRTSTIYSTGLGDDNTEYLVLTGDSSDGVDFSLRDYYNSSYPKAGASLNPFSGVVLKAPKASVPFPANQKFFCTSYNSAATIQADLTLTDIDFGAFHSAAAAAPMEELPEPANVLCGLLGFAVWTMPDDTASNIQEDFEITLVINVKSWKPLIFRPRRRKGKGRSGGSYRGKRRYTRRRK